MKYTYQTNKQNRLGWLPAMHRKPNLLWYVTQIDKKRVSVLTLRSRYHGRFAKKMFPQYLTEIDLSIVSEIVQTEQKQSIFSASTESQIIVAEGLCTLAFSKCADHNPTRLYVLYEKLLLSSAQYCYSLKHMLALWMCLRKCFNRDQLATL